MTCFATWLDHCCVGRLVKFAMRPYRCPECKSQNSVFVSAEFFYNLLYCSDCGVEFRKRRIWASAVLLLLAIFSVHSNVLTCLLDPARFSIKGSSRVCVFSKLSHPKIYDLMLLGYSEF
jgi:hypothetical protein